MTSEAARVGRPDIARRNKAIAKRENFGMTMSKVVLLQISLARQGVHALYEAEE